MAMFSKRLAGAGYVVLNVIRAMNIISLLAVMAASMVMLVRTFNNNTFFFFDACEHLIRVSICGFLILTELPLFKQYFSRTWPLFSQNSGFVMLGASMLLVGNSTLANLNKDEASIDKLGLPFWRLVIGSGIVVIVMGSVNILASYIFRDTTQGLTARQVRVDGATASHKAEVASSVAASTPKPSRRSRYRSFFLRSGTEKEQHDSLPSYHTDIARSNTVMTQNNHQRFGNDTNDSAASYSASSPYGLQSPMKHVPVSPSSKYSCDTPPRRPDPALHPAMNGRPF